LRSSFYSSALLLSFQELLLVHSPTTRHLSERSEGHAVSCTYLCRLDSHEHGAATTCERTDDCSSAGQNKARAASATVGAQQPLFCRSSRAHKAKAFALVFSLTGKIQVASNLSIPARLLRSVQAVCLTVHPVSKHLGISRSFGKSLYP